jgi:RNA polymerase sigma-70 factor (ECF subfamily)
MTEGFAPDDPAWLGKLADGDPVARGQFYDLFQRDVLGWCRRLGGISVDAEDAAHDVFMVALGRLESFRGESALRTWLFGITRRVLANQRRKAKVRWLRETLLGDRSDSTPDRGPGPLRKALRNEQVRRVHLCLDALSAKHREVLVICALEGRSGQDAAELLGIPEATVYSRLHYARAAFKKMARRQGLTDSDDGDGAEQGRTGGRT